MMGLPKDLDLSFLHGSELEGVCFNLNQLFLKFHPDIDISIACACLISTPSGGKVEVDDLREAAKDFLQLMGKSVMKAERSQDGGLTLGFDGGHVLQILNDDPHYETFQVRRGHDLYVA